MMKESILPLPNTSKVDYSQAYKRMLAALANQQPLATLTTREHSDPVITLLDTWAVTLEVLNFYQQRYNQENYLSSATEMLSIRELARTIGYELSPGVAASTFLTLAVNQTVLKGVDVNVPKGIQVKSLPTNQDSLPQVFETDHNLRARVDWNLLKPYVQMQLKQQFLEKNTHSLRLAGIATRLQKGDLVLLIGKVAEKFVAYSLTLQQVEVDTTAKYTTIMWQPDWSDTALYPENYALAENKITELQVIALRTQAAIFGHNAPLYSSLSEELRKTFTVDWDKAIDKAMYSQTGQLKEYGVYLDQVYPHLLAGQWVIAVTASLHHLYKINIVQKISAIEYTLSGRVTALGISKVDGTAIHPDDFSLRDTTFCLDNEVLNLFTEFEAVAGAIHNANRAIILENSVEGLETGHKFVISSLPGVIQETVTVNSVIKIPEKADKTFTLILNSPLYYRYQPGTLSIKNESLPLAIAVNITDFDTYQQLSFTTDKFPDFDKGKYILSGQQQVQTEVFTIKDSKDIDGRTHLLLSQDLQHYYHPTAAVIFGNVVAATHGETIQEVLGSGDGTQSNQQFTLARPPLTYLSAPNARGVISTLEIRVNDVLWREVESLHLCQANDKCYMVQRNENDQTVVIFGDGVRGARLPNGYENVHALYRSGIGFDGLLPTNSLTLFKTQPLGVSTVNNLVPATGAAAPESFVEARKSTSLGALTIDRIVSLQDYEFFTQTFAGIRKSQIRVMNDIYHNSILHITIAGAAGISVSEKSSLYQNLFQAIELARNPGPLFEIQSYEPIFFKLTAQLTIDPTYVAELVLKQARQQLVDSFSFDKRELAKSVALSEVIECLQGVAGVIAVEVTEFNYTESTANSQRIASILVAKPARLVEAIGTIPATIHSAQLLTINPLTIELTEKSD